MPKLDAYRSPIFETIHVALTLTKTDLRTLRKEGKLVHEESGDEITVLLEED